jgi:long-chain fatty acid transport protein
MQIKKVEKQSVRFYPLGAQGADAGSGAGEKMIGKPDWRRRVEGRLLLFGTAASLVMTGTAEAAGFYLQEQSVRGWGRANSGEVADQGPASLWWNPAAIAGITEAEAAFGATGILPSGRVSDAGTLIDRPGTPPEPVGGLPRLKDPILRGVAPNNAFAMPLGERIALGLAVTAPFSFTSRYDPSGWQRYSAIRTRLLTLDFQSSVALKATDWLSLGAALNLQYSDAWLSNALPNLTPGSPDARLRLTGNGWDLGWSAGLQLRPSERVSIGLAYKSAIEHKTRGPIEVAGLVGPLAVRNTSGPATVRFATPWQLLAGARVGLTPGLTLNAQAVHFGWSKFDILDISGPVNNAIEQNYKDTWSLAVGFDQSLGKKLTLRGGVQVDPTPTRDANRDPRVPDGDRVNYNVGATYRMSQHISLDAAASLTDVEASSINRDERFYAGTPAQVDVLTEGRVDKQHVLILALGGRMKF